MSLIIVNISISIIFILFVLVLWFSYERSLLDQPLIGLVLIDVEFDMEDHSSIPAIVIGRGL
jgi:hypothetical protein